MRIQQFVWLGFLIILAQTFTHQSQAEDLISVYQQALEHDPELAAKQAALDATEQTIFQAWASLLPDFNVSGYSLDNRQRILFPDLAGAGESQYNSHGYEFTVRQPIFRIDRWMNLGQAKSNSNQAQFTLEQALQDLALTVAERYFAILSAENNLFFVQKEKASIKKEVEQARSRFELGAIAITDVLETEARYDQSDALEVDAKNNVEVAREQLKQITGKYHKQLSDLNQKMPLETPNETSDIWVEKALTNNPELKSTMAAARTAKLEIYRQTSEHLPNIDVVGNSSYTVTGGRFGNFKSKDEAIGIEASINLFQSGNIWAKTREASHRFTEAQMQLESARRLVVRQTQEAYLQINAKIARIKALKKAKASSQKALEAITEGYKLGSRTIVDLLNAQTVLHKTERDLAQAYYDYVLYQLRLREAGGVLGHTDLVSFNQYLSVPKQD